MQNKNFEQNVKDLLYDHQEKAPDVMGKVFEKRTPFYIFRNKLILNKYKLIAATLIVAIVIGYFGFTSNSDVNQAELTNQSNTQINKTESNASKELADKDVVKGEVVENHETADLNTSEAEKSFDQETKRAKSTVTQPASEPTDVITTKPTKGANPNLVQTETTNLNNNQSSAAGATRTNEKLTQVPEENNPSVSQTSHEINEAAPSQANNNPKSVQPEIIENNPGDESKTVQVAESIERIELEDLDGNEGDDFGGFESPKVKPRRWSVSMSMGPAIGQRVLRSSNTDNGLIELRDNTEYQKTSMMAEITLNYRLAEKWEGYLGINGFNRQEKMEFSYTNNETFNEISEKKVIEYHPVYGQRELTIYDTVVRQRSTVIEGNSSNKYKHVSIPFGVRRTFYLPRFEKWSGYLTGQFGFEVINQSRGQLITNTFETMQLGEGFSRTTVGGTAGFGAGISYLATRRLSIIAEPRAMFFLNPTNNSTYTISQKDRGYGLMFGLKFGL